jgi:hypothetical protein
LVIIDLFPSSRAAEDDQFFSGSAVPNLLLQCRRILTPLLLLACLFAIAELWFPENGLNSDTRRWIFGMALIEVVYFGLCFLMLLLGNRLVIFFSPLVYLSVIPLVCAAFINILLGYSRSLTAWVVIIYLFSLYQIIFLLFAIPALIFLLRASQRYPDLARQHIFSASVIPSHHQTIEYDDIEQSD